MNKIVYFKSQSFLYSNLYQMAQWQSQCFYILTYIKQYTDILDDYSMDPAWINNLWQGCPAIDECDFKFKWDQWRIFRLTFPIWTVSEN